MYLLKRIGILRPDRMIFAGRHCGQAVTGGRCRIDNSARRPRARIPARAQFPCTFVDMYSIGRSIEGTMSPMPAKWKTNAAVWNKFRQVRGREYRDIRTPIAVVAVLSKISFAAADEVVDHANPIIPGEKEIHHVAADEPRPACHDGDRLAARRSLRIRRLEISSCGGHCSKCRPHRIGQSAVPERAAKITHASSRLRVGAKPSTR